MTPPSLLQEICRGRRVESVHIFLNGHFVNQQGKRRQTNIMRNITKYQKKHDRQSLSDTQIDRGGPEMHSHLIRPNFIL